MVTVVIPIFKTERFISQCVESVMNQSYRDLQIILVDGESPDRSRQICEKYAARDDRIQILSHKNLGLSSDRNVGIEIAKGEYITFADGDDFLTTDAIQNYIEAAERTGADIVSSRYIRCEEDDTPATVIIPSALGRQNIYTGDDKMSKLLDGEELFVSAWAKLYRRELFNSIQYPVGRNNEDVFTTYKLVHEASKICCIDNVGYVYRDNQSGLSKGFTEARFDAIYATLEWSAFIKEYYPAMQDIIATVVIYSCNLCLMRMSKYGYKNKEKLSYMQDLYCQYGRSYLNADRRLLGKLLVAASMMNIRLSYLLCYLLQRGKGRCMNLMYGRNRY